MGDMGTSMSTPTGLIQAAVVLAILVVLSSAIEDTAHVNEQLTVGKGAMPAHLVQVEDGGKKREAAAAAPSTTHVAGVKKADITKAAAMRDPDKEAEHETGGSRKAATVVMREQKADYMAAQSPGAAQEGAMLAANEVPMESKPLAAMRPGWLGGELPGLHGPTPQSAGEKLGPVIGETQELRGTGASVHDRSPLRPGMEVTLRGGRSDTFGCNWYKCGTPQSSTFEVVDGGDGLVALRMGGCWERRKRVKCERGHVDAAKAPKLRPERVAPGQVTLRSVATGNYFSHIDNKITCDAKQVTAAEIFLVKCERGCSAQASVINRTKKTKQVKRELSNKEEKASKAAAKRRAAQERHAKETKYKAMREKEKKQTAAKARAALQRKRREKERKEDAAKKVQKEKAHKEKKAKQVKRELSNKEEKASKAAAKRRAAQERHAKQPWHWPHGFVQRCGRQGLGPNASLPNEPCLVDGKPTLPRLVWANGTHY